MDEQEFKTRSDAALESLYKKLSSASDQYDFEPDFNSGALSIEFEEPKGRFVVSPNTPVRQIWVSAHSRSFKLDWDPARNEFVLPDTNQSLAELIESAIEKQIGEHVEL
ncbi:MAG TPA: iron donor protein CyaY [Bryobacteraceae bacterium]|jgi:iron donor protein CyaY|nr:iron donor protein CyaY [Bryobacteraceae bacterium]